MSEYQFYEFRAIDRPLTEDQKTFVCSLSSRASVTSHSASFVYHYGDFRGDVIKLMTDYFDAMMYMANWGSRRLIFRIPCSSIDMKQVEKYCISREINVKKTKDQKNVLLDIDFCDENLMDWIEGEDWFDDLVGLREELIQGDFRGLYLAWLKAAEYMDPDPLEPPVPAGLGDLSHAQRKFVEFLEIDENLIEVAAQKSGIKSKPVNLETCIEQLPSSEQYDFLLRLSRGKSNLSLLLNRRLLELAGKAQPQQSQVEDTQKRTIGYLIESATILRQKKEEDERRKAEIARQAELEVLASKKNQVWKDVDRLIEEKKVSSYRQAVELLKNLHDLAKYKGDLEEFQDHLTRIKKTYSNRPSLLRLLGEA